MIDKKLRKEFIDYCHKHDYMTEEVKDGVFVNTDFIPEIALEEFIRLHKTYSYDEVHFEEGSIDLICRNNEWELHMFFDESHISVFLTGESKASTVFLYNKGRKRVFTYMEWFNTNPANLERMLDGVKRIYE